MSQVRNQNLKNKGGWSDRKNNPGFFPGIMLQHSIYLQLKGLLMTKKPNPISKVSKAHKPITKASKPVVKTKNAKPSKLKKSVNGIVLLSGGNPQIAKADGDLPVQNYISALTGWKNDVANRLDLLIERVVPGVSKAVKWNSPLYGISGQGWFLGIHTYTKYIKVAFFRGIDLQPLPPGFSKSKETRYLDLHEGEVFDEVRFEAWVKQAAALPGWVP